MSRVTAGRGTATDSDREVTTSPDAAPAVPTDDSPCVVLVPGLGLDARAWSGLWPYLATGSTVLTLPAMGRDASGGADLSAQAHARRLAPQLPPGGGLVLVGHSASCQVVVEVAARDSRVRALVLIGPTTDPSSAAWPRMLAQWLRTARHEKPWEVGVLAPQYRRTGPVAMVRGMDGIRRHRIDLALTSVPARVVVIRGEHDRIASAPWCDRLAACSAGAVTTVAGAGHMVPLTHPHVVGDAINLLCAPPRAVGQ